MTPRFYRFRVQGVLGDRFATAFDSLRVERHREPFAQHAVHPYAVKAWRHDAASSGRALSKVVPPRVAATTMSIRISPG